MSSSSFASTEDEKESHDGCHDHAKKFPILGGSFALVVSGVLVLEDSILSEGKRRNFSMKQKTKRKQKQNKSKGNERNGERMKERKRKQKTRRKRKRIKQREKKKEEEEEEEEESIKGLEVSSNPGRSKDFTVTPELISR
ncbi:hypothetical protein V1477_002291, partial [Vespula maculifrons]